MKKEINSLFFLDKFSGVKSKVAFIDMMFDSEDPNYLDIKFIDGVKNRSNKTIVLCSGTKIPNLPADIICIGYQPSINEYMKKNIYWNLNYAPTPEKNEIEFIKREDKYAFIALGGYKNSNILNVIIPALSSILKIKQVDILFSPVNKKIDISYEDIRNDFKINIHQFTKSISPFLSRSSIVIASYGNLCFEALSHGAPLCVLGQKSFQSEYSKLLEKKQVAVAIEKPIEKNKEYLYKKFNELFENKNSFSKRASFFIKPGGIKRISNIIVSSYD